MTVVESKISRQDVKYTEFKLSKNSIVSSYTNHNNDNLNLFMRTNIINIQTYH